MVDPKTRVPEVNLAPSSRKPQYSGTSTSATKKLKIVPGPQEATQNIREDTPGFDDVLEKETFSHCVDKGDVEGSQVDSEDDEHDSNVKDIDISNPKDKNNESNLNDIDPNSNLNAAMVSTTITPNPNSATNNGSDKIDLSTLSYSQLRRMGTDRATRAKYGDEALLTALVRANFCHMILDQLHDVPRDSIPKKYLGILDEVIHEKTYAFSNELDVFAYDTYFSDHKERLYRWRIFEYKGNRTVAIPSSRLP
jgi:hypothetical protein